MGSFIWFPVIDNHTTFRGSLFQHSYPFILFFHKKLMHEIRKKLLPVIFSKLDTWPDMRLAYLMGTNSFNSVLAIAHEPREPPRITQIKQREGRRKWPCLGQLVSFFYFLGFLIFTNISTYMWMVIIYEWQPFLGFEIFLFALPCQWQFSFLCHFSCKCWLVQNCVC